MRIIFVVLLGCFCPPELSGAGCIMGNNKGITTKVMFDRHKHRGGGSMDLQDEANLSRHGFSCFCIWWWGYFLWNVLVWFGVISCNRGYTSFVMVNPGLVAPKHSWVWNKSHYNYKQVTGQQCLESRQMCYYLALLVLVCCTFILWPGGGAGEQSALTLSERLGGELTTLRCTKSKHMQMNKTEFVLQILCTTLT